ncbi:sulfotransferase family 2 domain-containing protein [Rhodovulum sp. DZ06]|uniref:sulfotransferase family 2 domain-containing protein n=1 Tax=Rhodovulum sp. DZ06 TaxID=3425126 RepID=UPI003D32A5F7
MLIHHPSNFALVNVPRTGGGALGAAMQAALGIETGFDSAAPDLRHLFASDARRLLGRRRWPQLHSVAVVRNPYDRVVGLYHDHRRRGAIAAAGFDAFVRQDLGGLSAADVHFHPQARFVEEDGQVLVKRLYAFEDGIQAIFEDLCARFDLAPAQVPHPLQSVRRAWEEYYARRDTLERVSAIYARDFELLGYRRLADPPGLGAPA